MVVTLKLTDPITAAGDMIVNAFPFHRSFASIKGEVVPALRATAPPVISPTPVRATLVTPEKKKRLVAFHENAKFFP